MSKLTRNKILGFLICLTCILGLITILAGSWVALVLLTLSLLPLYVAVCDSLQTKHSLLTNYPLIGRIRWLFENERSKIQQYFIENNTNGTPFNHIERDDVYQKAKDDVNTTPFGTQLNVYEKGYEYLEHSMYPKDIKDVIEPRVIFGSKFCLIKYSASVYNVSAMSFGAISEAAIRGINGGAKLGNFFQNTGEGGISPYHLENGGDICFQIGTGYFGAGKTIDGKRYFDENIFAKNAANPSVKMIEIKLSQGAKPGHGGILPAAKNSPEIAAIRSVEPHTDVISPPYHSAFTDAKTMLVFINKVRQLANGKPVGIKMCVGNTSEVVELISKMREDDMWPDFITIDGGEGGTGAAPAVFSNRVGTPLIEGLRFVDATLKQFGLRDEIKIIASGKATSSFDIIKLIALGADTVNAARAFMLSLGCIQARECNKNTCPVGIATQDKDLIKGLDPNEKKVRVYNFHKAVIHELKEVIGAMGLTSVKQLTSNHINHRNEEGNIITY